jgi:Protein of unknown function (DUF3592)
MSADLFGFWLLLLLGCVFTSLSTMSLLKRWSKRSWLQVRAVVQNIEKMQVHTDEGSYPADILHYSFSYRELQFIGTVEKSVGKYHLGQFLNVRFNPYDPNDSEVTFHGEVLFYLVFEISGPVALFFAYQLAPLASLR